MLIKNHTDIMNYIRESVKTSKTDTNKGVSLTLDGLLYDDLQDVIKSSAFDNDLKKYKISYTYNENYIDNKSTTLVELKIQWRE